jgi:hypothetical protein
VRFLAVELETGSKTKDLGFGGSRTMCGKTLMQAALYLEAAAFRTQWTITPNFTGDAPPRMTASGIH